MRHVHVSPTGGTAVVDKEGNIICVATTYQNAAFIVEAVNRVAYTPRKIDGLECVAWVKKYREDHRVPLRTAKDEWDRRAAIEDAK